jgi:predicted nucleic acid-binding protein
MDSLPARHECSLRNSRDETPWRRCGVARKFAWGQVCVSAVTLGELQAGIEMTRAQDATKARILTEWLDEIAQSQEILPMDGPCFREWARLKHRQSDAIFQDARIAATARVHGLTVATRNERDFKAFNVPLLNPFHSS